MKTSKVILALIILGSVFSNCKKDETEEDENNANTPTEYYIKYKENGQAKEFEYFFTGFTNGGDYWEDDGDLDMDMFDENLKSVASLSFSYLYFSDISLPITVYDTSLLYANPNVHFDFSSESETDYGHNIYIPDSLLIFESTINSFSNNIVSGTFEGQVFSKDSIVVNITDGTFKVLIVVL